MKKIIISSFLLGLAYSNEAANIQDDYYAELDTNGEITLAASSHEIDKDRSGGVLRKRIHKRKRKVRPPMQGK
jgi:hypothetical protein|tara:strand:- start:1158 stop:1376 length:219 start_codon:yes stop_codon:yes gene_type:complete